MTVRRPSLRTTAAAAVLAAAALLASACSNPTAGAAATIGDSRISEQQLNAEVEAILLAQQQPVDSNDADLASQTLGRMITLSLVDQVAAREGVDITQGAIDAEFASYEQQIGSREDVESTFAEQGVAPSQIEAIIRLNLQAQALGPVLAPDGTADEQSQAVFDAVVALGDEVGVDVSPRYGAWDSTSLGLGAAPDDLASLPAVDG